MLILAIAPFVVTNAYYRDLMFMTYIWAGLAAAWNIIGGYAGQLSIGHAAFFGVGAYASAILYSVLGVSPWIGMLVGGVIAGVTAAIIGTASLRLRGTFFVLATIAFAEVARLMAIAWGPLTRGNLGIILDFRPSFANMTWQGKLPYVMLAFAYMLLMYVLTRLLERTRFGYGLVALRENEDAAEALGVSTARYKVMALVLSAFLTAVGGAIFSQYLLFIEPDTVFGIMISVQMVLIGIIGGTGTALGPLIGALFVIPVSTFLRGQLVSVSGLHGVVYGVALVTVAMLMPHGIFGYILRRRRARLQSRSSKDDAARSK
jgi:branched-chain amino acid transport system permease protein